MLIRKLDRPDEWFALAKPMAIRTTGNQQLETVGDFQVMLRDSRGMFGVKTFDPIQTRFDHAGDDFIRTIQAWVSQNGDTTRLMNEFHGIPRRHFEFRHPGRTVLLEEPLKGFVQSGAKTSLDQGAGDMRTTRRAAIGQG